MFNTAEKPQQSHSGGKRSDFFSPALPEFTHLANIYLPRASVFKWILMAFAAKTIPVAYKINESQDKMYSLGKTVTKNVISLYGDRWSLDLSW